MQRTATAIDFAPILPPPLLAGLALLAALALGWALWRRARGAWWRALSFALLIGALLNPRWVEERRQERPDVAVLLVDRSDSARLGGREAQIEAARAAVEARAARLPGLELRTAVLEEAGSRGTALYAAVERALAEVPRERLAGVIALTDGQAHDVPARPGIGAPFHALLPGRPGEVDRRIRVVEAPGFGIVGREVELRVVVEDLGAPPGGSARLTVRRAGAPARVESIPVGREHRIAVPIERGGPTVVELSVEERGGEVSAANNRTAVTVNGVRDRLRVLLVSGEPHAGERTWRRLLKADPNVDLVHFTILRPPEKDDLTPLNELALIAFPVRELFQQKLREFDLIVFDRFSNRGILPPQYLRNVAEHVRAGGALLLAVGPEFAGPASLANTPLGAVLPARPPASARAAVAEEAFRAHVSAAGQRHPVTEALSGSNPEAAGEASWGRWYRHLRAEARSGTVAMDAPGGAPLLVLDRVGEGRVALLLSDHIWLWSRGHDGGGPQAELLRRIAHWLMREPELEEEDLSAVVSGGVLTATRRSVAEAPPPELTVTAPDGGVRRLRPEPAGGGRAVLRLPATEPGVWQVGDGARTAFAAAAAANPPESADLRADPAPLAGLLRAEGGAARWLGAAAGNSATPAAPVVQAAPGVQAAPAAQPAPVVPEIRMVPPGRDAAGPGWIGLRRNGDHSVTGLSATALLPPWLALLLVLGTAALAWTREGR